MSEDIYGRTEAIDIKSLYALLLPYISYATVHGCVNDAHKVLANIDSLRTILHEIIIDSQKR